MARYLLFYFFLINVRIYQSHFGSASLVTVMNSNWKGVSFYIPVRRDAIQSKLDAFHRSRSAGCCKGPKLFVPEDSVLPELRHIDRHPMYIGFGYMTSHDFDDYLKVNPNPPLSFSGLEVSVTIPFLARTSSGQPNYALALARFYEKSRGDIPNLNVLYPYIPVDEIIMDNGVAVVRNGSDEMKISFNRINQPNCPPPTSIVKEEFDAFHQRAYQFGLPSPEYSFCERHNFKSQFCENAERVKCGVSRYTPNICQRWLSGDFIHCATTVTIENITTGFRDFIFLGDDPIDIISSESYDRNFTLALKYPCED